MSIVRNFHRSLARLAVAALVAVVGNACGLDKQSAPDSLIGPSEFGLSLTLTAQPGIIPRDGASVSVVTLTARDSQGRPATGQTLRLTTSAGTLSATEVVTGSNGVATVQLVAPPASQQSVTQVTITATPTTDSAPTRRAEVLVVSVSGPSPNNNPVPSFTIVPAVANINQTVTVNASATTDEGEFCNTRCTYLWDFGDQTTDAGIQETHVYTLPGTYNITLTVQDDRGGVASTTRSLVVAGPAAPVAQFSATQSGTAPTADVTLNASASTVGSPETIESYLWDFGDGSTTQTTTVPAVIHRYTTAGTKVVTLTITDSLGRTASRTATITVN